MVNSSDLAKMSIIAGISLLAIGMVGGVGLPGSVQLPNLADLIGLDDHTGQESARYKVTTSIDVTTRTNGAFIESSSFKYDTNRCTVCSLSFTQGRSLAFLGADNLMMKITVTDSNGTKYVEVSKTIGEMKGYKTTTVDYSFSNIPSGNYNIKYHLTGKGSLLGQPIDKTVTKSFRVPETLETVK